MGEINLDADEIKDSKLIQEEAEMVEMQNGCICCTLRGDLLRTVKKLSDEGTYDYLVIESTGISEPLPVAQTFVMDIDSATQVGASPTVAESELKSLSNYATLDTCVTVVDALNIFDVLASIETLADKNNSSNMLGNTGAREDKPEQHSLLVQALEWQALNLVSQGTSVQKMVAEMVDSADMVTEMVTAIKEQVPGMKNVNSTQVLAAATEINDKYRLQELATRGGKEAEAAVAAITAAASARQAQVAQEVDDRSLSQLMLDQLEFANVIVVSKASLLLDQCSDQRADGEKKIGMIEGLLHKLNPKARVIIPRADKYGDLDVVTDLLNTGMFDMEDAQNSAGWMKELQGEHTPETEEYGISSLTFKERNMPFHPGRLRTILNGFGSYESALSVNAPQSDESGSAIEEVAHGDKHIDPKFQGYFQGVVRAKGFFWLANAHAFPIGFHAAGKQVNVDGGERPFQCTYADQKTFDEQVKAGKWTENFGDRQSVVVFIGVGLNKALMMQKLQEALLTEKESQELGGIRGWAQLEDPFFGGDAAKSFMDLPEHFKQHLARQKEHQHADPQVFECVFEWEQIANAIRMYMCVK